jgi:hypothetical protein
MAKKTQVISHNYTGKSLSIVFINGAGKVESKIVDASHANWKQVERAYKAQQLDKVIELIDITKAINNAFAGKFTVKNGKVFRGDEPVAGYLFDKILQFMREGLPYKRLLLFADNLYANPSQKAHKDLYKFLEHGNFPITDDGCFLAYKGVQANYYSITGGSLKPIKGKVDASGKIFNGVGEVIEVDRKAVNPNEHETCSYGLHAGSFKYANGFKGGGKLVIVKINPKDVVSIPVDEDSQKLRTCRYEVVYEEGQNGVTKPLDEVKDSNLDKVAKVRNSQSVGYHNVRGANGRFTRARN